MRDIKSYIVLVMISFLLVTSVQVIGQQVIYGYMDNQTKFAQFDCIGIIINDSLFEETNQCSPFVYANSGNQYIDTFKIQCSYGHDAVIFINIPNADSVNLGEIPMFASGCLYHFVDDRNNIFSEISTWNVNRKTKRFYRKRKSKIDKYVYKFDNHKYKLESKGDYILIDLRKYIK